MESIVFIAKVLDIFKKMGWDSPYKILRTIIVIVICVLIGSKINAIEKSNKDLSVIDIYLDELMIGDIKEQLSLLGDSAFITRIRYEQADNDAGDDLFCFKDAYGIISNNILNLKDYNPIYKSIYIVDPNTKKFIRNLKSLESVVITESFAYQNGYTSISKIIKRQNLPIDRFRLIVVKDSYGVVWVFTLAFADNSKITDDYTSKYYNYGYDRLYKLAAAEQQKINLRSKSLINDLVKSYK